MLKKKLSSFNDGVVGVYSEKSTLITDFTAKTNARTIEDYNFIMDLCFSEQTKRQEDFLFAEAMGKKLTWKIKTPLVEGIESDYKIIFENDVYDIINLDSDKKNNELYIYLERGREIEK
jgi:SPP1 family predicted phage head-tail adaptor